MRCTVPPVNPLTHRSETTTRAPPVAAAGRYHRAVIKNLMVRGLPALVLAVLDEPFGCGRGGQVFALGGEGLFFGGCPVAGALEVVDLDAFEETQEVQARGGGVGRPVSPRR
ncbi:hypothetical protein Sros01_82870 [Streptomyces roseochromogenus]|nr:hypothetical protein Sros01_82870 [Streptomyces roseochromogenus]